MSRRHRRLASVALATVATVVVAGNTDPVAAHAIGGTFQLPVPLWLYLAGAAIAVAASFVATILMSRAGDGRYRVRPVAAGVSDALRLVLRVIGMVWWYGAIAIGFVVGDISPLPGVVLWIGIWVGLPIVAVLLGNPWPSLSPFRTTFTMLEWAAGRTGMQGLDGRLRYPSGLARWPAVGLLAAGIWAEVILPDGEVAITVASVMAGYTLLTLTGMVLFGQVAWLRNAELLEVELGWFGRIGPVGRRSRRPALCDGCGEACDPSRCIDCPECSVAADDREREPILRPWVTGLTDVTRSGWSDATFIVLALAGVSYDGMRETAFGATLLGVFLPPVQAVLGLSGPAFLLVDTLAFASVFVAFAVAFTAVVSLTRALADPRGRRSLGTVAGVYAATLLPIAAGYLIAHYLTLVIQGAVWLPSLIADPLMSLAPELDWIPIGLVWYLSVAAIVVGHIAGIVLAHRHARRDAPGRVVLAGLPMVILMMGYTVLSLWIIAQPIVLEPGAGPEVAPWMTL
ncbi:hypothetical protein BH23CHL9_BH23CHL9_04150 [soil metagenome]